LVLMSLGMHYGDSFGASHDLGIATLTNLDVMLYDWPKYVFYSMQGPLPRDPTETVRVRPTQGGK